jgi:hypothetical protein
MEISMNMDILKKYDLVYVVLILVGLRSLFGSDIAQACALAAFASLHGYLKYLNSKQEKAVSEDFRKELDDIRNNVSGLMMRNAIKAEGVNRQFGR